LWFLVIDRLKTTFFLRNFLEIMDIYLTVVFIIVVLNIF
jgi:hypothetical protein